MTTLPENKIILIVNRESLQQTAHVASVISVNAPNVRYCYLNFLLYENVAQHEKFIFSFNDSLHRRRRHRDHFQSLNRCTHRRRR